MKTTRNLWPYGLFAAFGIFFAGMATVVTIAATHREDLVSDNYYEQELDFQSKIDGTARARELHATITYDAPAQQVMITVPGKSAAAGTVEFYRPDSPALDQSQPLALGADGIQKLPVAGMARGPWRIRAIWQAGDQHYYLAEKFIF